MIARQLGGTAALADVLVVGAGPTGLALAAQLHRHGATVVVIDAAAEPVRESRAFGVQPRSLEILRPLGVTERLLAAGRVGVRLAVHGRRRTAHLPLFDHGVEDTEYPFVLFVPQSETEAALISYLADQGVPVHRGRRYLAHRDTPDGVAASVAGPRGLEEITARFIVGCDGARSAVRQAAGVEFAGHQNPQRFLLADLDLAGELDPGCVHAWFSTTGLLFLFPIGRRAPHPNTLPVPSPASWRLVTTLDDHESVPAVQRLLARHSDGLESGPVTWVSEFRVSARQARHYRVGPVFLAGDAAHVHSPAGGQGMNTGLQDAWNLGWKLALVTGGRAPATLLDTYDSERWPVGRGVVDLTDRLLRGATSPGWGPVRAHLAPHLVQILGRLPQRSAGFRRMGQLAYHYRASALSTHAAAASDGFRAGDRLPDLPVTVGSGANRIGLHRLTQDPGFHLLVCRPGRFGGPSPIWEVVATHEVSGWDPGGRVVVVRPDGHIGYLGETLTGAEAYLGRWLSQGTPPPTPPRPGRRSDGPLTGWLPA